MPILHRNVTEDEHWHLEQGSLHRIPCQDKLCCGDLEANFSSKQTSGRRTPHGCVCPTLWCTEWLSGETCLQWRKQLLTGQMWHWSPFWLSELPVSGRGGDQSALFFAWPLRCQCCVRGWPWSVPWWPQDIAATAHYHIACFRLASEWRALPSWSMSSPLEPSLSHTPTCRLLTHEPTCRLYHSIRPYYCFSLAGKRSTYYGRDRLHRQMGVPTLGAMCTT